MVIIENKYIKLSMSKIGKKHLIKIVTLFIASQYKNHATV